uniref:Zyxin n=1 Tax=Leptobrachium leishanense TaxID=445787 RepID=A0A8C5W7L4_9ANUR
MCWNNWDLYIGVTSREALSDTVSARLSGSRTLCIQRLGCLWYVGLSPSRSLYPAVGLSLYPAVGLSLVCWAVSVSSGWAVSGMLCCLCIQRLGCLWYVVLSLYPAVGLSLVCWAVSVSSGCAVSVSSGWAVSVSSGWAVSVSSGWVVSVSSGWAVSVSSGWAVSVSSGWAVSDFKMDPAAPATRMTSSFTINISTPSFYNPPKKFAPVVPPKPKVNPFKAGDEPPEPQNSSAGPQQEHSSGGGVRAFLGRVGEIPSAPSSAEQEEFILPPPPPSEDPVMSPTTFFPPPPPSFGDDLVGSPTSSFPPPPPLDFSEPFPPPVEECFPSPPPLEESPGEAIEASDSQVNAVFVPPPPPPAPPMFTPKLAAPSVSPKPAAPTFSTKSANHTFTPKPALPEPTAPPTSFPKPTAPVFTPKQAVPEPVATPFAPKTNVPTFVPKPAVHTFVPKQPEPQTFPSPPSAPIPPPPPPQAFTPKPAGQTSFSPKPSPSVFTPKSSSTFTPQKLHTDTEVSRPQQKFPTSQPSPKPTPFVPEEAPPPALAVSRGPGFNYAQQREKPRVLEKPRPEEPQTENDRSHEVRSNGVQVLRPQAEGYLDMGSKPGGIQKRDTPPKMQKSPEPERSAGPQGLNMNEVMELEKLTQQLMKEMDNQPTAKAHTMDRCGFCGQGLSRTETIVKAGERHYHVACFTCSKCDQQLQGRQYYENAGKPLCEECYEDTLERCAVCDKKITERLLKAMDKAYHPGCFTCAVCRCTLQGVPFIVDDNNKPHCVPDYHRKYAPRCSVCSEPIAPEPGRDETVRVFALERNFHMMCYKCEDCGIPLSVEADDSGCFPFNNHVLCDVTACIQKRRSF